MCFTNIFLPRPFCPARSKRRQFEKYFSSIDGIQRLGRARFLIPTTADKFEEARCWWRAGGQVAAAVVAKTNAESEKSQNIVK